MKRAKRWILSLITCSNVLHVERVHHPYSLRSPCHFECMVAETKYCGPQRSYSKQQTDSMFNSILKREVERCLEPRLYRPNAAVSRKLSAYALGSRPLAYPATGNGFAVASNCLLRDEVVIVNAFEEPTIRVLVRLSAVLFENSGVISML